MRPLIRSRRVALPLAALALAGTGVAAYGAVGDDSVDYRTVGATTGSVEQELSLSGTISPSGSSELAFGAAGTVAKVRVEQGDTVEEGDVIAVLDRASLRAAVDRAASDLASAKAQLADDREAQTTAVTTSTSSSSASAGRSGSSGSSSGSAPSSGTPSSGTSSSTAAVVKQLTAQQDAVLAAQTAAGTALSAAGTALADQQAACADPVTTTESTDAATDSATDSATDGTTADAGTTTTAVLSEECSAALAAVQSAQATASEAQTVLQTALETLGSTLTEALGSVQADPSTGSSGGGSTGSGSAPSGTGTTGSTGATGSSAAAPAGGASGQTVTAATLAQDQASIDRAKADLASAEADLAGAVVRAPADGTVASLAVATDDEVAAGDTVATVVAPGLTTVSVEATATQAAQLEQGMDVEVTPAGATEALAGAVSRIEHVATSDSSTGSDPTYTVGIVLDERDLQLADGMPASVTAVVGAADDVVVVPASAVSNGSVTVVEDGVAQRVRVTTGIVGATQIEVTDGLEAGDEVVLADLDADLPSGGSEQGGFGGGGFGGGGGGFPAGGPPSGVFRAP